MAKKDKITTELIELENKWKRALADYQNLEKRVMVERAQFVKLANVGLLEKFLMVLDNLELACNHINDEGLKIVLNQFLGVLKTEGVEEIKAEGEMFDPKRMDCIERVKGEKDKVMKIVKKGYKISEIIIRPAQVAVGE